MTLFVSASLFTSCSSDSENEEQNPETSQNDYWPTAVGNQWVLNQGGNETTMKILSAQNVNGETYFKFDKFITASSEVSGSASASIKKVQGDYYIKMDDVPPKIVPLTISDGKNMAKQSRISFKISDNLSGIKTYNGKIDGKWVLMQWDYKTKVLSYTFDNIAPGNHNFELAVSDYKNNVSQYTADFYR